MRWKSRLWSSLVALCYVMIGKEMRLEMGRRVRARDIPGENDKKKEKKAYAEVEDLEVAFSSISEGKDCIGCCIDDRWL